MGEKYERRLCGYGGQGIIIAGFIIGQAATVYEGRQAVFIQDYGPEARGGACRADVIVAREPIRYPYIRTPSVLAAMSQTAYDKYILKTDQNTKIIIEEDLVKPRHQDGKGILTLPARRLAEEAGRAASANIVMLGFFTAVTGIISLDAMKKSLLASVPKNTGKLNMDAFEKGYTYAQKHWS